MRRLTMAIVTCAWLLAFALAANAQQIEGEYVETRSADVYTGPCFANAEAGLLGDQAILAWRVSKGSWNGVRLDGLSVVAAAKASSTIGDIYNNPYPAKAVLIVDERASEEQRAALKSFAQEMGGELLEDVVAVESAPISLEVQYRDEHPSTARLSAGQLASIRARLISDKDHFCGNEELQYKPMAPTTHAMAGVALLDEFRGEGLGVRWTLYDKRSVYIGHFAR